MGLMIIQKDIRITHNLYWQKETKVQLGDVSYHEWYDARIYIFNIYFQKIFNLALDNEDFETDILVKVLYLNKLEVVQL